MGSKSSDLQPVSKTNGPREYRLDVHLSRELSSKLELLKKEVLERTGKRVSKAELVIHMIEQFFERV